ncbi:MAG TPA: serine protease, partial [Polyangiaceae bacterium LLY-WYZ-15_(1-7)]|nr:serine protease [Polyangiaceae bacterium LLY-WYZ-15_(1-7)]
RVRRVVAVPEAGHGSGVLVDPNGVIVTAAHVVADARHVAVRLPRGGGVHPAVVVHRDDALDFALLLVRTGSEHPATLPLAEAPPLRVRQTVDAIGYPLDPNRDQPQSTRGIVSAGMDGGLVQLGISVNPGNSGGPLIDEEERLVGIVVARGNPEAGVQGIGVAVPIAPIRAAYEQSTRGGAMSRAWTALGEAPVERRHIAEAVDAIVRLGGPDVLAEAAQAADGAVAPERLRYFAQLARTATDPDVMALLSGYFWDATLVALERAGGWLRPEQMPQGPARDLARRAAGWAFHLAQRAVRTDPSVVQRSPFLSQLVQARAQASSQAPQAGSAPTPLGQPEGARVVPPPEGRGWFPMLTVGPTMALVTPGEPAPGLAVELAFPAYLTGSRRSKARLGILAGAGFSMNRFLNGRADELELWDTSEKYSFHVHALAGLALRLGGPRVAFVASAAWTPGWARDWGCWDERSYYGSEDTVCVAVEGETLRAGRFSVGVAFGRFHLGLRLGLRDPDVVVTPGLMLGTTF